MAKPSATTMRIFRILPEQEDPRNQWHRAEPLRHLLKHLSGSDVAFDSAHFADSQQLFGSHDPLHPPQVVTWTGEFKTNEGVKARIAVGGGLSGQGPRVARMHATLNVQAPGQPVIQYYVLRPEQPLPLVHHNVGPGAGTVFQDVSPEEHVAVSSILGMLSDVHLPTPGQLPVTRQDRANPARIRRVSQRERNVKFAEDFRVHLLGWFKENVPSF
ncbi:hypothetical protein HYV43_06910 [Candidatus Micrarchaeota archaeon]|nr:hypothetical protein [Candidatus Micrarchaeota archaeon]